jgi:hypothetical protein
VFQQSCSSICDSANICVRTCVAASVFAFCVAASVYSFVLQHLCSHLCFSICVPTFVFQHLQRLLCVLHKQSIAINDNLNHLLQSSVMAIFPTSLIASLKFLGSIMDMKAICDCLFFFIIFLLVCTPLSFSPII